MDIILASGSPRRKVILGNTSLDFKVITSDIDEKILEGESPQQVAMRLSFEKCMDIAFNNESSLVIGADTIVVLDDMILGKPKDKDEAYCMLKKLSNKVHQVITGISLINLEGNKKIIDYVVSNVKFKD